jgi:hypothetical protein
LYRYLKVENVQKAGFEKRHVTLEILANVGTAIEIFEMQQRNYYLGGINPSYLEDKKWV